MTAAKALPLLDPLQAPTRHRRAKSVDNTPLTVRSFKPPTPLPSVASSSRVQNTLPASVAPSSHLQPPAPTMTTKIDIPALSGALDAATITAWLATCEDTFEAWDLLNPTRPLEPGLRILLASLKLESPVAAQWWCENRETLKKSGS